MAGFGRTVASAAVLCLAWASLAWAYSSGAPSQACSTMVPQHGAKQPQASDNPYQITVSQADFVAGETLTVTLSSSLGVTFKGVLLQARLVNSTQTVGRFQTLPSGLKLRDCTSANDSVTHSNAIEKQSVSVLWTSSVKPTADFEFVATFVHHFDIFWARVKSSPIQALQDPCDPSPCYNGFPCFKSSNTRAFFCGCEGDAFSPPLCAGLCDPNPCQNDGECTVQGDSFTCECDEKSTGQMCEVACTPDYCLNGGTCRAFSGQLQCACPSGWTGAKCEISQVCQADSCQNGGICVNTTLAGQAAFTCRCPPIFTGSFCETAVPCRSSPCKNGATCIETPGTLTFTCSCADGFQGDLCEIAPNPCDSDPCLNGGTCYRTTDGDTLCVCQNEFSGDRCEIVHPCTLPVTPCLNGGTCFRSSSGSEFFCACPDGFTGSNCETPPGPCWSNPCANGGACSPASDGSTFQCSCASGYFGPTCENRGACFGVLCSGHGTCVAPDDQTRYMCQCEENYDGDNCQYMNACQLDNPCGAGSTCQYLGAGQTQCTCRPWLTGADCDFDLTCVSTPCRNGGTCTPGGDGTFQCACGLAYSGPICQNYTDPCDLMQCLNGGECFNAESAPRCLCSDDYSGAHCETKLTPTISNCPEGNTATFPLRPGTDSALINITATDRYGQSLRLTVTGGLTFPGPLAYAEEYREGKDITVTAQDADARRSTCRFRLRLTDEEKPVVRCPADVSAITTANTAAVDFPSASAVDNLALDGALRYSRANGSRFQAGSTTVIVEAEDTFGNKGECTFTVTVHKKASDCGAFPSPDNGRATCGVDGDQRTCTVACQPGFGNAVGVEEHECQHQEKAAFWAPRPNTDVCVPFRPGNGVSRVLTFKFAVPEELCNELDSIESGLTEAVTDLGACGGQAATECELSLACNGGGEGGRRRRRLLAAAELTAEVRVASPTAGGETSEDVQARLDAAVEALSEAAAAGSLTATVDGQTIANDPSSLELSDSAWDCKAGQISSPDGCLSCPPGTSHDAPSNRCVYCPSGTYQNKPEEDSCVPCPGDAETQQDGAFSVDQCGAQSEKVSSPWTPTLIGIVGGAGSLIILLILVLALVFACRARRGRDQADKDGPFSNLTHLNRAFEGEEPEMQFHGGAGAGADGGHSLTSDTTYQNVLDDDQLDSGSTDHLVRIPSLSQYSDYYATLNARSAPPAAAAAEPEKELPPDSPPPPPPVPAPGPPMANGGPLPPPPPPPLLA